MIELLTLWRVIDLRLLNGSSQKSATDSIPPIHKFTGSRVSHKKIKRK